MKKITSLSGIISALIVLVGSIFKTLHWPGAGIIIVVGIALFAVLYATLLFIDKQKYATDMMQKISNICVYIAMVVISLGFLFKVMHWPGAGVMIYLGFLPIIALLVVSLVRSSAEKDALRKLNVTNEAVIIILWLAFTLILIGLKPV